MRNPERIGKIMSMVQILWEQKNDMRYFQFIMWLEHEYSSSNNQYGKRELIQRYDDGFTAPYEITDLFYLEDDLFETFLESLLDNH